MTEETKLTESVTLPSASPTEAKLPESWGVPRPATIPSPTYFPAATAFGITFLLWGFVTSPVVFGMGFVVLVVSIVGWMGELRRDK
jgi:hypothetical protein